MSDLLRLAKELGLPLVATNDLHYTHAADATSHAALLCVQSGSTLDDPNRFKFDADEFYLKSAAEMRQLFRDHPEACDNTLAIAERCDVQFNTQANYMPRFPVPEGENEQTWFVKEVEKGLHERYPAGIPDEVRAQADYEIGVISQMGFPGYFLVVADFINWSKRNGIRVGPGPRLRRRLDGRLRHADHRPRPAPARPDLRAVPEPRPRLHARLRRRLRRPPPRRGHQVRDREVRRGARRPDRHVRHDQGQAGAQGLLPRARLPVRDGRQAHQGDAAARHGQGHPAHRDLRQEPPALQGGGRHPRRRRERPGGEDGLRHGARPREPQAAVGRARGRRHHVVRSR